MEIVARGIAPEPLKPDLVGLPQDLAGAVVGSQGPPRSQPRLVIRVGVTGHRPNGLPKDRQGLDALRESSRSILQEIQLIADDLSSRREAARFQIYSDKEPLLRLISPLAEGSDRLVAEEAIALGYELQSPLPFTQEEYLTDFEEPKSKETFRALLQHATSVLEIDGSRTPVGEAYEAVGRTVLRQCDVLIAIWDGCREEGVGGTAQIVREALSLEIPTIWIHSKLEHKGVLLLSADPPTFLGTYASTLSERLRTMFIFAPAGAMTKEEKAHHEREIETIKRFFTPGVRRIHFGFIFKWFREFWCFTFKRLQEWWRQRTQSPKLQGDHSAWRSLFSSNPNFRSTVEQNYRWADYLANYYGGLYRSSFILTFSMGAFAILFAFLGFYMHRKSHPSNIQYLWFGLELAFIIIIVLVTFRGRKNGWHERWMDYRLLAESLRQVRFLAPLGRVTLSLKVPAHLQPSDPRNTWFNWYYRALIREGGMLRAKFDGAHLKRCRETLLDLIREQIEYHETIHAKFKIVSKRLHGVAQALFVLTAIACALHLTEHWLDESFSLWLNLATIVLPAFGAALSAISHQGEFERLAIRSKAMAERLTSLANRELPSESSLTSRDLGRAAETFSEIMFGELLDWRFAFLEKQLELPA